MPPQTQTIPAEPQGIQPPGDTQSLLSKVNQVDLSTYILEKLRNDISDRESHGFEDKRLYDIKAYEGKKKPTVFPWKNAANYAVPLTPTLVDTAHPNIINSIFFDSSKVTTVKGVGKEDIRSADNLSHLLNWQLLNEMDTFNVMDMIVHRAFKHGTGVVKVVQGTGVIEDEKVILENIPFENIFLPITAKGFQVKDTDHIFQLIEWSDNDKEKRKALKLYEGLDDLQRGFRISTMAESMQRQKDEQAGSSVSQKQNRDSYFILECYLTYYFHPDGTDTKEPKQMIELVCWIAPKGGKILKVKENTIKDQNNVPVRPYAEFIPYPRDDRFYGMSLPEKIKQTQEELDHSHNQNINAADKAIASPGFYPQGSDFDPEIHQIVPGGMYPVSDPGSIVFQPVNVNPIFERQEEKYWDLAERLTGLTELFQGRVPDTQATLGATVMRNNRTEIRFKALYKRFEEGWKKMMALVYLYDQNYMTDDKKIRILGTADFKSVKELFPEGLQGRFDFSFSSEPVTEREVKTNKKMQLGQVLLADPLAQEPGNRWRVLKLVAEELGERNLETIIQKPPEAGILSAEEAIQRIMSGQIDLTPDPNIDADAYIFKIQLFMKTDTFANADNEQQQSLVLLLRRSAKIKEGRIRAILDQQIIRQGIAQRVGGGMIPAEGSAAESIQSQEVAA